MAALLMVLAVATPACTIARGPSRPSHPAASPSTSTTTAKPLDLLSGYAATEADWKVGHQLDPLGTGYWPRLSSGYDTYTSVRFIRGRALEYTEHVYPPLSTGAALKVVDDELPPDAHVVYDRPGKTSCQQVVESSRTITALAGVEVLIELYGPGDVSSISYQPFTGPLTTLPSC
jgi:hypothetical protein